MERVAFLTPDGGRVFALINPEELTFERRSGVRMRNRHERPLAVARRSDDPLIVVGGGITDLKLNLLFDVDLLARSSPSFAPPADVRTGVQASPTEAPTLVSDPAAPVPDDDARAAPAAPLPVRDVRELSGPLWRLAENGGADGSALGPPIVHFIWGAAWNIPCVVLSVAERFDQFAADGTPLRSWVRIHLRRTHLPTRPEPADEWSYTPARGAAARSNESLPESVVLTDPVTSSRPDLICDSVYGDLRLMHALLEFNDIDDFWSLEPGRTLLTPPASVLRSQEP